MKTRIDFIFHLSALVFVASTLVPSLALGLEVRLPEGRPGLMVMKPGGFLAKIDGALLKTQREFVAHQRAKPSSAFRPTNPFLQVRKGRILIDARADGDATLLLASLNRLGLHKGSKFADTVSGWLPIGLIHKAGALAGC